MRQSVKVTQLAGGGKEDLVFWLNYVTKQMKVVFQHLQGSSLSGVQALFPNSSLSVSNSWVLLLQSEI